MKKITRTFARLVVLPMAVASLGVVAIAQTPAQAQYTRQTCRRPDGAYWLESGDQAYLQSARSGQQINIRSQPSIRSRQLHYGYAGDAVTVLDGTVNVSECYNWLYVQFNASGARGWVRGDLINSRY